MASDQYHAHLKQTQNGEVSSLCTNPLVAFEQSSALGLVAVAHSVVDFNEVDADHLLLGIRAEYVLRGIVAYGTFWLRGICMPVICCERLTCTCFGL